MSKIRVYCQLCRLPALFTALADIMLGFLLSGSQIHSVHRMAALMVASAGLYLSGMVWNDIFDRQQDAEERPKRPIPSGRVSLRAAVIFASTLMLIGLSGAAVAGRWSFVVAGILTACIFLYDGVLKQTPLAPVFMGGCRFLNVILGASTAGDHFTSAWQHPQLWVAGCLGVYIMGVTLFARTEAVTSRRWPLLAAAAVINVGLLGLATWYGGWTIPFGFSIGGGAAPDSSTILLALCVVALTINRRIVDAIRNPEPIYVQAGVRMMLLSVIMLDAMGIYFQLGNAGVPYAIATALLVIPSLALGKWMSMT